MRLNYKLVMEYDGAGLAGWQRQKDQPSVQGALEAAFHRVTGQEVTVIGAGRTDAGVHARGQTAHAFARFAHGPEALKRALNACLPPNIAVIGLSQAEADFHARFHAKSKLYDYYYYTGEVRSPLARRTSWGVAGPLDVAAMRRALACLVGRHDFAAFQSAGSAVASTVRTIFMAELAEEEGDLLRLSLEGDGFLRHMVRAVAGTLLMVGQGRLGLEGFAGVLESRSRARAGVTAPAQGLFLRYVRY